MAGEGVVPSGHSARGSLGGMKPVPLGGLLGCKVDEAPAASCLLLVLLSKATEMCNAIEFIGLRSLPFSAAPFVPT